MFRNLALVMLAVYGVALSAVILKDGVHRVPSLEKEGKIFFEVESLRPLGFESVKGEGITYLMYGDHTFKLMRDGSVIVNFVEGKMENACVYSDDGVYVSKDLVNEFLKLSWYRTPKGELIGMENPPDVVITPIGKGKMNFVFKGDFCKDMVEVRKEGEYIVVEISPVSGVEAPKDVDFDLEKGTLTLRFSPEIPFIPKEIFTLNGVLVEYDVDVTNFFGEVRLSEGVVWKRKRENHDGRSYVVDYIDLELDKVRVEPVIAEGGIGDVETVKSMVDRTGAIIGINANYFDPKTGNIVGLLVKRGRVLSGRYGYRPILYITEDGRAIISNDYMEVVASFGKVSVVINAVNAPSKMDVVMYTPEYSRRIPRDDWRIYFLVKNGRVVSRGYKERLEEGEILIGIDRKYKEAFEEVGEGEGFDMEIRSTVRGKILHAVEGGPFLIKNGLPLPKPKDEKSLYGPGIISSRRARTIVAIRDPKVLTFITVEDGGNGMNYDDMVSFLSGKGYLYAMCLDGGSSSTLVVKGKVVNISSERTPPRVPVGLLVWEKTE